MDGPAQSKEDNLHRLLHGLNPLFSAMGRCLSGDNAYGALSLCLAVPDVCSSLEFKDPDIGGVGKRYRRWYCTYLPGYIDFLTPENCWSLRNGLFHNGTIGNKKLKNKNVVFSLSSAIHLNLIGDGPEEEAILLVSLPVFCKEMAEAGKVWAERSCAIPGLIERSERLFSFYQNGLERPGMRLGFPLIENAGDRKLPRR